MRHSPTSSEAPFGAGQPPYAEPVPSAPFVVPPLLLIAILLVSAGAKLRDPRDTSSVFLQLGLPEVLLRLHAPRLLPSGELALAAFLLLAPDGWYVVAATGTLLLFLAYFLVILRAVRLPYGITCGCFGRLGLGLVTRWTLVRNGVLLAVAVITWADSWRRDGVLQRLLHLGDQAWWLAGVLLTALVVGFVVREEHPTSLPEAQDLEPDPFAYQPSPIPYGVLHGPEGTVSVWQLSDAAARLLVFCDPGDPASADVLRRVPGWAARLVPVRTHVVSEREWSVLHARFPELRDSLLGDPDGQLRRRLAAESPGAVLLGTDRLLAGGPVTGAAEIEELVEAAAVELAAAAPRGDLPLQEAAAP